MRALFLPPFLPTTSQVTHGSRRTLDCHRSFGHCPHHLAVWLLRAGRAGGRKAPPGETLHRDRPGAERIREFPGRLKAPEEAQLSFRLGGELQSLKVHEGQEVKQGELIAQLDDTDYRLKLSDRQASFDLTRSQLTRMEQLVERQMVSQAEYDQRKAQFNSAEAALNLARQELAYTRINAPFDGVVARTHVEQFQVVQPNQPIATLYSSDSMDVVFQVPENLFSNLRRDLKPEDLHSKVRLEKPARHPDRGRLQGVRQPAGPVHAGL
ncbi:efflux RND transporter periplasmic adaptor subunit [Halopseudomonas pachastrellae]|nr:efflux RND transporter periplasmic adaptor subunit [Halopseudomonas pachastrellae]